MKKLRQIALLLAGTLVSAQALPDMSEVRQNIANKVQDNLEESRKYGFRFTNSETYEQFLSFQRTLSGKLVDDDDDGYLGYLEANGEDSLVGCRFMGEFRAVVRPLLSRGAGLLQPVYGLDEDGKPRLDWEQTERMHALLTQNLHLNLLPLDASRQYDVLVRPYLDELARELAASRDYSRLSYGGFSTAAYYQRVLSHLPEHSYLVEPSKQVLNSVIESAADQPGIIQLKTTRFTGWAMKLENFSLDISPIEKYRHANQVGLPPADQGCFYHDIPSFRNLWKQTDQRMSFFRRPQTPPELEFREAKERLLQAQAASRERFITDLLPFMARAFEQFRLSGAIRSEKLK